MLTNLRFSGIHLSIPVGPKTERLPVADPAGNYEISVISRDDLNQLCKEVAQQYSWVQVGVEYYTPQGRAYFTKYDAGVINAPDIAQTFARVEIRDIHGKTNETDNADLDFHFQLQQRGGASPEFRPLTNSNAFFPGRFQKSALGTYQQENNQGTIVREIPARL